MKKNILLILLISAGIISAMDNTAQDKEHRRLEQEGLFLVLADTQQVQRFTDKKVEELGIKQQALEEDYAERMAQEQFEVENLKAQLKALKEKRNKSATALPIVSAEEVNAERFVKLESVDEKQAQELIELRTKFASLQRDHKESTIKQQAFEEDYVERMATDEREIENLKAQAQALREQKNRSQFWTTWALAGGAIAIGTIAYFMRRQQSQIDLLTAGPIIITDEKGESKLVNVVDEAVLKRVAVLEKEIETIQKNIKVMNDFDEATSKRNDAASKRIEVAEEQLKRLQNGIDDLKKKPSVTYIDTQSESNSKKLEALQKELAELKKRPTVDFEITKSGRANPKEKDGMGAEAQFTVTITDKNNHELELVGTARAGGYNKRGEIVVPGSYYNYQNTGKLTVQMLDVR